MKGKKIPKDQAQILNIGEITMATRVEISIQEQGVILETKEIVMVHHITALLREGKAHKLLEIPKAMNQENQIQQTQCNLLMEEEQIEL